METDIYIRSAFAFGMGWGDKTTAIPENTNCMTGTPYYQGNAD